MLGVRLGPQPTHGAVGILQCGRKGRFTAESVVQAKGKEAVLGGQSIGLVVELAGAAGQPAATVEEGDRRPWLLGNLLGGEDVGL